MKQASLLLLIGSLLFAWLNLFMTEQESGHVNTQKYVGQNAEKTKAQLDSIIEEIVNKGITENIEQFVAPDYVAQILENPSFRFEGIAQLTQAILQVHFHEPGYQWQYDEFWAYNDRVVFRVPGAEVYPGGIPKVNKHPEQGRYGLAVFNFEHGLLKRTYFLRCQPAEFEGAPETLSMAEAPAELVKSPAQRRGSLVSYFSQRSGNHWRVLTNNLIQCF